jgi:hypothetical protein
MTEEPDSRDESAAPEEPEDAGGLQAEAERLRESAERRRRAAEELREEAAKLREEAARLREEPVKAGADAPADDSGDGADADQPRRRGLFRRKG